MLLLRFGGRLLVRVDPLPEHADVAIVLNGSYSGVVARSAEAMRMLADGRVDHVMLSVGAVRYYGEWVPDLAERYVREQWGAEMARNVMICTGIADSTAEEIAYIDDCLESTGWRDAVFVTSNYHTRRAHMIIAATLAKAGLVEHFTVHGVTDGDFRSSGWWRERRYAKTWLLETTKLLWYFVERVTPGGTV